MEPEIVIDSGDDAHAIEELIAEEKRQKAQGAPHLGAVPPQQGRKPKVVKQQLVCAWEDGHTCMVARANVYENGDRELVEKWRHPTASEAKQMEAIQFIRGGVVGEAPAQQGMATWKKVALGIGGVAVVAGVGFVAYNYIVDGEDDEDDEDDEE